MQIINRLKPQSFEEIYGQEELTLPSSVLRKLVEKDSFSCLIFVGPPGTGKTSLAELICSNSDSNMKLVRMNASSASTTEIKSIIKKGYSLNEKTLIFIDEIHRFNKSQQSILLEAIDNGIKIIGASTENPIYKLNRALRSRSQFFYFKPLEKESLKALSIKAIEVLKLQLNVKDIVFKDAVMSLIINNSDGDCRKFLTMLETAAMIGQRVDNTITIDMSSLEKLGNIDSYYDEDEHYDLLSAMIKSIRGSDPDASLIWCFKLLDSGVDIDTIFRRLIISASEDVGNAYPDAIVFSKASYDSFNVVGFPEGKIILSQLVTYLASCPKSNASYLAGKEAAAFLKHNSPKAPNNIKHNNTNYLYPHDYQEGFVSQNYGDNFPTFYNPKQIGFEEKIGLRLKRLWKNYKNYE